MQHRGVAVDDLRNAGPIAFFAPKEVTGESFRQTLTVAMRGKRFDTLTLVGRSIFADCFFADRCGHAATVASFQA